jgi:hypothetical protein
MHTPKRLYINNLKLTNIFSAQARRSREANITILTVLLEQENHQLQTEWEITTRNNNAMRREIMLWQAYEAEQARTSTSTSRGYDCQHPDMAHQESHQPPPPAGGGPPPPAEGGPSPPALGGPSPPDGGGPPPPAGGGPSPPDRVAWCVCHPSLPAPLSD